MREIKFRLWDSESRKMCDWGYLEDIAYETDFEESFGNDFRKYEVMQYTGLKDSNGKDIYEGDIVDNVVFNGGSCYDLPQKIYFEDGCFCVGMGYIVDVKSMEVIGNVYENDYMLDKLSK